MCAILNEISRNSVPLKCLVVFSFFFLGEKKCLKRGKRIEKRFRKMKVKEEEEKRQKAKKDTVDDKRKGDDGDKQKKDGSVDKRKRKDDDYIAGEELEQQIRAEVERQRRQEQTMEEDRGWREDLPGDTLIRSR